MTRMHPDRALETLLRLKADEEPSSGTIGTGADSDALPTLDERVILYLRAMHGSGRDFSDRELAAARSHILDSMAADFMEHSSEEHGDSQPLASAAPAETARNIRTGSSKGFWRVLRNALLFPLIGGASMRLAVASILLVLAASGAWTGLWLQAASNARQVVAGRFSGTASNGFACGSQSTRGFPFRIEFNCKDPKATVTTGQSTLVIDAKDLHVVGNLFDRTVVAEVTGPLSISEPGKPPRYIGNWIKAQTMLTRTAENLQRATLTLETFQFYRTAQAGMEPLLTGERLQLEVAANDAQGVKGRNFSIDARVDGGALPLVGPGIPSDAFAASVAATLYDPDSSSSAPILARLRAWQQGGGKIDIQEGRIQQGDAVATATGAISLNATGQLQGKLQTAMTGDYAKVAESFMDSARLGPVAQNSPSGTDRSSGTQTRSVSPEPGPQTAPPKVPTAASRDIAIRFENGAVYLGPTVIGTIPALF